MIIYKNYINGKWISKKNTKTYSVRNYHNKIVSQYPETNIDELNQALDSALYSFENDIFYKNKIKRLKALNEIYLYLKKNTNNIIQSEIVETGKLKIDATNEIKSGINLWKSAIKILRKTNFQNNLKIRKGVLSQFSEPIGVVGLIIPWNYPFIVACERLPFIIAAGCSVVLKPSEFAAASISYIVESIDKSSAPNRLINLVHGAGKKIGKALVSSQKINMISFTGSTSVAKEIVKLSNSSIKKLSLELGGKNPMIITADADIDKSIKYIIDNFLENAGQACVAGSLLYIEDKIYKKVKDILKNNLESLKISQFPITKKHNKNIKKSIIRSLRKGSKIVFGIEKELKNNNPVLPYILENVNSSDNLFLDEIFGTVLILKKFKKFKLLVNTLNKNQYGLAVYLYSNNKKFISYFKENIRYGRVWINCSLKSWDTRLTIGGFRNSGYGSETSFEGLKNYMVNKSVILRD